MLRVARIVPEFCTRARPENRATPCVTRNKEFLARGVFYPFNCCTNANKPCRTAALGCQNKRATDYDYRCLTAEDAGDAEVGTEAFSALRVPAGNRTPLILP
jgi:hypothetical protein